MELWISQWNGYEPGVVGAVIGVGLLAGLDPVGVEGAVVRGGGVGRVALVVQRELLPGFDRQVGQREVLGHDDVLLGRPRVTAVGAGGRRGVARGRGVIAAEPGGRQRKTAASAAARVRGRVRCGSMGGIRRPTPDGSPYE